MARGFGGSASAIQLVLRLFGLAHLFHTPVQNGHSSPCSLPGDPGRVGLAKRGIEHGCHRFPSVEGIGDGGANSGNPVLALREESTMYGPTIVIWLVLLVLALTVVAFATRLVEKYRLAERFSRVREKPSLSPEAAHPILKHQ